MANNTPAELKYSKSDEWVRVEGDEVVIGITDYAQDQLGDIVYIELPPEEDGAFGTFEVDAVYGSIESVKAAAELYIPVAGEVVAVNVELEGSPETVNEDPYGAGWMLRVKPTGDLAAQLAALLDAAAYAAYCEERDQ